MSRFFKIALATAFAGGGFAMAAGPITTVPWNGHVGAVSFTFDDGMQNQIDNLKPILDKMPDVTVTFFIPGFSSVWQNNPNDLAALAQAGHEIGNHSLSHPTLTGLSADSLTKEIVNFAESLEKGIPAPKITAFATPFCANSDDVTAVIKQKHFINRDCGDWAYRNSWNKEPNWFKFPALTWLRSSKKPEDITVALDTCIGNADFSGLPSWESPPGPEGEWMVVLNHGVAQDNDDYAIDPADIKKIIQHARDNKMWVASFSTIGAYYMAHFTLDAVSEALGESANIDAGIKLDWKLPSENMPESIPLKVKLGDPLTAVKGKIVMDQGDKAIWPDSSGHYTIEFTKLSLKVRLATAEEIENHGNNTTALKRANQLNKKPRSSEPHGTFDLMGRRVKNEKR